MSDDRTYVSELTPPGRGAIATLQISGDLRCVDAPPPLWRAANGRSLQEQTVDRVCFGWWGTDATEEVVICRVAEDAAEVHCHGGRAAVAQIVSDLQARGARVESAEEMLRRTASPVDAECRLALTRAMTERTAMLLTEQASGVLRGALQRLDDLLATDDSAPSRSAAEALERLRAWSRFGLHLTSPWSVVLCGRPNVGKSSLVNALAGFARSIVSPQPGTTRDVVTPVIVVDGWPIELSDTAGLRETSDDVEAAGVARATSRLQAADLLLLLLDAGQPLTSEDQRLLGELPQALVIAHKCDLPRAWTDLEGRPSLDVSAVTGQGLTELMAVMVSHLVPRVPETGTPLPVSPAIETALIATDQALQRGDVATARRQLQPLLSNPEDAR